MDFIMVLWNALIYMLECEKHIVSNKTYIIFKIVINNLQILEERN